MEQQHDCDPLPNGNITLFANGINTPANPFSRVIELDPRSHKTVWEYRARPAYTLFSPAYQRRPAPPDRQYAHLRRPVGSAV